MNEIQRLSLKEKLENPNLSHKERAQIELRLYKMDNRPEWGLRILFGSVIIFMLILAIVSTSK